MGSVMGTSCIIDSGSIVWAPCFRKPRTEIRQTVRGEVVIELDGVSHTASYEESSPGSPATLRWDDGDRWTQSRRWCWRHLPHTTDTPVLATTSEATLGTGPSTLQATTSCYSEQMSDAELAGSLTATLRKLEGRGDAAGSSLAKSECCARVGVQVQQKLSTEIDDCACCGSRGGSPKQDCDEAVVFAVSIFSGLCFMITAGVPLSAAILIQALAIASLGAQAARYSGRPVVSCVLSVALIGYVGAPDQFIPVGLHHMVYWINHRLAQAHLYSWLDSRWRAYIS